MAVWPRMAYTGPPTRSPPPLPAKNDDGSELRAARKSATFCSMRAGSLYGEEFVNGVNRAKPVKFPYRLDAFSSFFLFANEKTFQSSVTVMRWIVFYAHTPLKSVSLFYDHFHAVLFGCGWLRGDFLLDLCGAAR